MKQISKTPATSVLKTSKNLPPLQYHTPSDFKERDKENFDPKPNENMTPPELEEKHSSPKDLPDFICDLSQALETSNNTVQSLKNQLETVLQQQSTLEIEHDMLRKRYEALLLSKNQIEVQCKEKEAYQMSLKSDSTRKIEELKEIVKQKNKMVEMKNIEITEFTAKLQGIMKEHSNEIEALNNEISSLKNDMHKNEDKQLYFSYLLIKKRKEKLKSEQLAKKLCDAKKENENLQEIIKEKDLEVSKFSSKIKNLESELVENENANKTIEELQVKIRNMQTENENLRKAQSEAKRGLEEKKAEMLEIKEKSGKIQQRVDELRKIESDLRAEYNSLHNEKEKLKQKSHEIEEELNQQKELNKKLQNAVF